MRSIVAIAGIRGSYSEQAVIDIFGKRSPILECPDFDATFSAIETGKAKFGLVPIRNKIVERIGPTYGPLHSKRFKTLERHRVKVEHLLVSLPDSEFKNIRSVRSHPDALKQCRGFLEKNPQIVPLESRGIASSIREIAEAGDPAFAAIGSRRAAELYGTKVLLEDIMDEWENWTEFCLFIKRRD